MRVRSFLAVTVIAIAVLLGSVGLAAAAPVPWESADIVVHDEGGQQILIISGTLPADVPLPAEVEMPVPAGLQLSWAGEILGGDPANDPAADYKVAKRGDSDVYSFKLTKSRTGQLELAVPGAVKLNGTTFNAALSWTPSQDLKSLLIGFRIPQGAQIGTPLEGANLEPGPTGYAYYRKAMTDLKAGQPVNFAFNYSVPVPAGVAATSSPTNDTSSTFAIIAVLLAVAGVLIFAVSRKMQGRAQAAEESDTVDLDESDAFSEGPSRRATPAAPAAPAPPRSKGKIIGIAVTLALVLGGFFAVQASSKPQIAGDVISRTFASVDSCTNTVIRLKVSSAKDVERAADTMFDVLQTTNGVGGAKVYRTNPRIEIAHCDSVITAEQLKQVLAATGFAAAD